MPTGAVAEQGALAFQIDAEDILLQRVNLVGSVKDGSLFGIEAQYVHHFKGAAGELPEELAISVVKVEVVEAVAPGQVDELAAIPWQELDGGARLKVLGIILSEERA